jgi:DNA (cytosine-5)-methyltransferase 1
MNNSTPKINIRFERTGSQLSRITEIDDRSYISSIKLNGAPDQSSDLGNWWYSYLRGIQPDAKSQNRKLRVAELFCGSGGLAQGVKQFCMEVGIGFESVAVADIDEHAVAVYKANHKTPQQLVRAGPDGDLRRLIEYELYGIAETARFQVPPSLKDSDWDSLGEEGGVDLLLAGPPCQGHSNLNNHTRRDDRRNLRYLDVPAVALALECKTVIIENVPAVQWDKNCVVDTARTLFEDAGYNVEVGVLQAASFGWPQSRSRFFMIASKEVDPLPLEKTAEILAVRESSLDLWWAISEFEDAEEDQHMFRQAKRTPENNKRIDYLFAKEIYDLPDDQRPPCHSKKPHTYPSVYGRLKKDKQAPTITTGFLTTGRGRYIHPTRPRTLNPREAARLQGFPDDYVFDPGGEPPLTNRLLKWIGDAVPMPLGYAAALSAYANTLVEG